MPIEPMSETGQPIGIRKRLNDVIAWINTAEKAKITGGGGINRLPDTIDLSQFPTRTELRRLGLDV